MARNSMQWHRVGKKTARKQRNGRTVWVDIGQESDGIQHNGVDGQDSGSDSGCLDGQESRGPYTTTTQCADGLESGQEK